MSQIWLLDGNGGRLTSINPSNLLRRFTRRSRRSEELLGGPLRGELLGAEHLAERARAVARRQRLALKGRGVRRADDTSAVRLQHATKLDKLAQRMPRQVLDDIESSRHVE